MAEKSGLPTMAAISGVNRSFVSAVTTPPQAAPITTPPAISTTFPRRMNFLKPSSIRVNLQREDGGQFSTADGKGQVRERSERSDAHGHHDIPVLVVVSLSGTQLAGRLSILQLQPHFTRPRGFEEVHEICGVEADGKRIAGIGSFDGILGLARLRGLSGELQLALLQLQAHT